MGIEKEKEAVINSSTQISGEAEADRVRNTPPRTKRAGELSSRLVVPAMWGVCEPKNARLLLRIQVLPYR